LLMNKELCIKLVNEIILYVCTYVCMYGAPGTTPNFYGTTVK
jgi:hypothetical protein